MGQKNLIHIFCIFMALGAFSVLTVHADEDTPVITIKNHHFYPEELKVPAGEKVKIIVRNQDASPEEFESYDLKREKVINSYSEITLFVGPLRPGVYKYFGEFNQSTAKGVIIAGAPAK